MLMNQLAPSSPSYREDYKCIHCVNAHCCLSKELHDKDLQRLSQKIKQRHPLHRGESLVMMSDEFVSLFIVRSGFFKSYLLSCDGEQQIVGFFMPGDVLGVDAINMKQHRYTIEALDTASVCTLSFHDYELLLNDTPKLQRWLLKSISRQVICEQEMLLMLGKMTAEQRVAHFILDMHSRTTANSRTNSTANLPMSRTDIANYLGLAVETISRLLTRLQNKGVLMISGKSVTITDFTRLQEISDHKFEAVNNLQHVA